MHTLINNTNNNANDDSKSSFHQTNCIRPKESVSSPNCYPTSSPMGSGELESTLTPPPLLVVKVIPLILFKKKALDCQMKESKKVLGVDGL